MFWIAGMGLFLLILASFGEPVNIWMVLGYLSAFAFGAGFLSGTTKHWGRFVALTLLSWSVIGIVGLQFTATHGNALQRAHAQVALDNLRNARDDVAGAFVGAAVRLSWAANAVLPQDLALPSVDIVVSSQSQPSDQAGSSAVQPRPTVSLAELRSRPLPLIPQEIKRVTAAELINLGAAQITVENNQTTVTVGGVVSPTLSTDESSVSTRQWSRLIVEGLDPSLTLPITQTVTVQRFQDDTLLVSSKPISDTVQLWLRQIERVARPVAEVDELPEAERRIPKDDPIRGELRNAVVGIETLLDFQPELLPALGVTKVEDIPHLREVQELTSRIRLAQFTAQRCEINQAPLAKDQTSSSGLQGYVNCNRRLMHQLDARRVELLWLKEPGKNKQEIKGWPELHSQAVQATQDASALVDLIETEIRSRGLNPAVLSDAAQVYDENLLLLMLQTEQDLLDLRRLIETP